METENTTAQQPIYPEQDPVWLTACTGLAEFLLQGEMPKSDWERLDPKTRVAVAAYAMQTLANETPMIVFDLLNGLKPIPDQPPTSVSIDGYWDGAGCIHTTGEPCASWKFPQMAKGLDLGCKAIALEIEIKKMGRS